MKLSMKKLACCAVLCLALGASAQDVELEEKAAAPDEGAGDEPIMNDKQAAEKAAREEEPVSTEPAPSNATTTTPKTATSAVTDRLASERAPRASESFAGGWGLPEQIQEIRMFTFDLPDSKMKAGLGILLNEIAVAPSVEHSDTVQQKSLWEMKLISRGTQEIEAGEYDAGRKKVLTGLYKMLDYIPFGYDQQLEGNLTDAKITSMEDFVIAVKDMIEFTKQKVEDFDQDEASKEAMRVVMHQMEGIKMSMTDLVTLTQTEGAKPLGVEAGDEVTFYIAESIARQAKAMALLIRAMDPSTAMP